ncbi:MAG TPA: aminotransferase class I/II-fold pyridoxal phosphate-dependent enzyme, partial [Vicinamibacteria bacterium]|nr:aminotransferase class I/II-fold pyridoxal phosphate-dependent enzyme [Vicinamibacteria bacterium]
MSLSRRSFLNAVGAVRAAPLPAALIAARGREAALARAESPPGEAAGGAAVIRIDSNENPLGPGPRALEAFVRAFPDAGRYPTNARPSVADLRDTIARRLSVRPENVALGAGSWELLRTAVRLHTSSSRHLVTASPSFELPEHMAGQLGLPVRRVPVDEDGRLDLDRMARAARWAGLVFFCNPNNPTGTVHSARAVAEFVTRVRRESPETAILIDEAYHDYVGDAGHATALPLALEHANVVVTRTFSKAHGMAGLRVGCAVGQTRTIEAFARWAITFNQSSLGLAAAIASLEDPGHIEAERARNAEVRGVTTRLFRDLGFRVLPSEANFVFVEIGRPAREFREACARRGVMVGREFPPLEKTHARISLGTLEEMRRAGVVFSDVLGKGRPEARV